MTDRATPAADEPALWTSDEITRLVSESGDAAETLSNIVRLIQQRFSTDVCSVYLLEADRTTLFLAATIGLRPESVGRVRMRLNEGLVGLVAEQLRPQVGCRAAFTTCGAADFETLVAELDDDDMVQHRNFLGD